MDGKATTTSLLGLGLVTGYFLKSEDGATVRAALSDTAREKAPPRKEAHAAIMKMLGALAFVMVATIAASGSDFAGQVFVGFFILVWVVALMVWSGTAKGHPTLPSLPKPSGPGKPVGGTTSGGGVW